MNQRENLNNLFRRSGYSYAPVEFKLCPALMKKFKEIYGVEASPEAVFDFPWRYVNTPLLSRKFTDWMPYYPDKKFNPGTEIDDFLVAHEPTPESMHMSRMYHPMRNFDSIESFENFPFPEFAAENQALLKAEVDGIHSKELSATAFMQMTIWEQAWYMRSMDELMVDMMTESENAVYLFDRITGLAAVRAEAYALAGVDILQLGDDIGMQQAPMMSVEFYRQWLKKRLKQVIGKAKQINPAIIITYHSCGFITPFIPELIDAGVDVLNPVQPECMDFAEIHREFGKDISFWGTIGTQTTMPFETPDKVKQAVWRNLDIAGKSGGLFCAPTHLLEPEVPWNNIEAYVEACRKYGV